MNKGKAWVNWYFASQFKERALAARGIVAGEDPVLREKHRKTAALRAKVQAKRDARLELLGIVTSS